MRSPEEWDRLETSYCRGSNIPALETVQNFVDAILCEDANYIDCVLIKARRNPQMLVPLFQALAVCPKPTMKGRVAFHSAWVTQGLHIRDFFAIDALLPAALANMMPGYSGPDMELFRGERWSNYQRGNYGPSWTSKHSVARMFAGGLNCEPDSGGVILKSRVPASAILAGPEYGHMRYESEYLVDRRSLLRVEIVERIFYR